MNSPYPAQTFCREVVTWKTLCHPNVLPLLGATMTEDRFVMVSEWMTNGSINEFLKAQLDADRLKLVRIPFKSLFLLIIDG
jgi:serine/threonine protein kinase